MRPQLTAKQHDKQFAQAEAGGVPLAVILGDDELAQNKVNIKQMGLPKGHPEKEGVKVDMALMVPYIKTKLAALGADAVATNGINGLKLS